MLFVADPLSEESETNENNNIAARPVAVTQALTSHEQTAGYTASVMPNSVASGSGGALRVQLSGTGLRCIAALDLSMPLDQRVRSQALLLGVGRANQNDMAAQNLASAYISCL